MHIMHCIAGLGRRSGGPSVSVPALCGAIAGLGHHVTLVAGRYSHDEELAELPGNVEIQVIDISRRLNGRSFAMKKWLAEHVKSADIVHVHGLWMIPGHYALNAAFQHGKPSVLSPKGMLEVYALQRHWVLKKLAWAFWERRISSRASCFQATSLSEVASLRRQFARHPICYVPHGVEIHGGKETEGDRDNYVLYLGRIHPHKNLDLLLEAWSSLEKPHDARLVLAGPIVGNYGRYIARLASGTNDVKLVGETWGSRKWELIRRARALVLPSKSENFGMVVAEALACQTPVIATRGTPWEELERFECGWWVEPNRVDLAAALKSVITAANSKLAQMGANGRRLVESRYVWDRVAEQMVSTYVWMLGGSDMPAHVSM